MNRLEEEMQLRISFGHHVQILSLDIQMPPLGCGIFKVCFPKQTPGPPKSANGSLLRLGPPRWFGMAP